MRYNHGEEMSILYIYGEMRYNHGEEMGMCVCV
jgi:hypothetical protein